MSDANNLQTMRGNELQIAINVLLLCPSSVLSSLTQCNSKLTNELMSTARVRVHYMVDQFWCDPINILLLPKIESKFAEQNKNELYLSIKVC